VQVSVWRAAGVSPLVERLHAAATGRLTPGRSPNTRKETQMLTSLTQTVIGMVTNHWFWGLLTLAVLVWYSTITVYVAFKGVFDIQHMLQELAARGAGEERPDQH
jgi:hypothetical protein